MAKWVVVQVLVSDEDLAEDIKDKIEEVVDSAKKVNPDKEVRKVYCRVVGTMGDRIKRKR